MTSGSPITASKSERAGGPIGRQPATNAEYAAAGRRTLRGDDLRRARGRVSTIPRAIRTSTHEPKVGLVPVA